MVKTGTDSTDGSTETRVLQIRFGRGNEERVAETLRAVDDGEEAQPYFEVVLRSPEHLHRVTRPKNLELLRTIAQKTPESIRATARLIDRDVSQVHDNLSELESLGLIEFEADGRTKRPTVWYDEIDVELSLRPDDSTDEEATA